MSDTRVTQLNTEFKQKGMRGQTNLWKYNGKDGKKDKSWWTSLEDCHTKKALLRQDQENEHSFISSTRKITVEVYDFSQFCHLVLFIIMLCISAFFFFIFNLVAQSPGSKRLGVS